MPQSPGYFIQTDCSFPAAIASGGTTSAAVDLIGYRLAGFAVPAGLIGTALTFQVSTDGVAYQALYDSSNTAVSVTVAASRSYGFKQDLIGTFLPFRYLKLISNATETNGIVITLTGYRP